MKIAVYKCVKYGGTVITDALWIADSADYVRVSEHVEVDFPPRSFSDVVTDQITALEKSVLAIETKAYDEVQDIKARIRELQCLPAPESV